MVRRTEILDAADQQLRQLFPGLAAVYRDLVPTQFVRPSAMVALEEETMALRTRVTVARTMELTVLLFCPVDAYHNAQTETLSAMADAALEHFSAPGLPVGDRVLEIGTVKVSLGADYAALAIPLAWDDGRIQAAEGVQLLERAHLSIQTKQKKE